MRLTDLSPAWVGTLDGRHGTGVSFDCPCCRTRGGADRIVRRIHVMFVEPLDGGAPVRSHGPLWKRIGESFETLTLTPSVDASSDGHWHGHVTNGEASP